MKENFNHTDCQPFKHGRFAQYYAHILKNPPLFFHTLEEEQQRGSTPGQFIEKLLQKKGLHLEDADKKTSQLKLFSKDELKAHLLEQINQLNPENRQYIENLHPDLQQNLLKPSLAILAAIDWAEQTHKITIQPDKETLDWLKTRIDAVYKK